MPNPPRQPRQRTAWRTLALAAALLPTGGGAQQAQARLDEIELRIGEHVLHAEVARTAGERDRGLMLRPRLDAAGAMLFVFERPQRQCFWMRDTAIALSAAFIADDGAILSIADMAPGTETPHCESLPVRYVLEVNRGWFAQHGLGAGEHVAGAPFTR